MNSGIKIAFFKEETSLESIYVHTNAHRRLMLGVIKAIKNEL
jgi:hypothetical protein